MRWTFRTLRAARRRRAKLHLGVWFPRWQRAMDRLWLGLSTAPPSEQAFHRFARRHARLLAVGEAHRYPPFGPAFWRGFFSVVAPWSLPSPARPSGRWPD